MAIFSFTEKEKKIKPESFKEKEKIINFTSFGNQYVALKAAKELDSASIDDVETFIKCLQESPLFNQLKKEKIKHQIQQLEKQLGTLKAGVNT